MPLTPSVDTYATEAQLAAYAAARGITVTGTPAVILTQAMDYLATLEDRWQGIRTLPTQPLAWPRTGVYVYGTELADDAIPQSLLDAQCRLALDADSGVELLPNVPVGGRGSVVREKVDVVEVQYAEGYNNALPIFTAVNGLLKPLMKAGGGVNFEVRRV
jgi:hypothetical protein